MSKERLAASVQISFNVYIVEEDELNTPNGHEHGYEHIQILDADIFGVDFVETERDRLKELYDSDGVLELDPDGVFKETFFDALDAGFADYYEI